VSASLWPTMPGCPGSGTPTIHLPEKWPKAVIESSFGCAQKAIHRTLILAIEGILTTPAALSVVMKIKSPQDTL